MTNQKMFDKVCAHLLTQLSTSLDDTGTCLYRGPDGKKCAIGCLIPDELYTEDIEMKEVRTLLDYPVFNSELSAYLSHFNKELLIRLQSVHDAFRPEEWYTALQRVAGQFDLTFNPPITQTEAS